MTHIFLFASLEIYMTYTNILIRNGIIHGQVGLLYYGTQKIARAGRAVRLAPILQFFANQKFIKFVKSKVDTNASTLRTFRLYRLNSSNNPKQKACCWPNNVLCKKEHKNNKYEPVAL